MRIFAASYLTAHYFNNRYEGLIYENYNDTNKEARSD